MPTVPHFFFALNLLTVILTQLCQRPQLNNDSSIFVQDCITFHQLTLFLGSPARPFSFLIDTGSLRTWIPTTSCRCGSGIDTLLSRTANLTVTKHDITYADGDTVYGFEGSESFTISNTTFKNVEIPMVFVTKKVAPRMGNRGIVALGYSDDNIFDVAWKKGIISTSVFILGFSSIPGQSRIFFDKLPQQIIDGNVYSPIITSTHLWAIKCYGVMANGKDYSGQSADNVIVDSGTTITTLNTKLMNALGNDLFGACTQDGANGLLCPSSMVFPRIELYLEGNVVYLDPKYYTKVSGPNVQVSLVSSDHMILGSSFFKSYSITFDKQNNRIGFYGQTSPLSKIGSDFFYYSSISVLSILGLILLSLMILGASYVCQKRVRSATDSSVMMYP